jgi:exopolysaccharide biosynthesis polyprenyl glycosylphosphotransferase
MVMQSVMQRPDLGYQLSGFVVDHGFPLVQDFGRFRALGTVDEIPDMVEAGQVDEIIVALPASAHEAIAPILGVCERHGVGLKLVPDLFEMSLGRVRIDEIAGIPLLDVKDRTLRRLERLLKRVADVVVAALLMVVTLPLVLIVALLVRLESGGPTLLAQTRVGVGGKRVQCLKFRTMRRDALEIQKSLDEYNEADGPLFKMRNDPRCTRVGKRLRQWSLDELPQIWNVLVGDMSLVGPRPPLPEEVARYDDRQFRRLEVKPGMTGIWQVNGRSDLGFDEMITMDLYYVQNWTLLLDFKILSRTLVAVLRRHGAY